MVTRLNQHTLKRVVIYGMPRTGTTVLLRAVCDKFGMENLDEIFDTPARPNRPGGKEIVPWIRSHKKWCAKFLTDSVKQNLIEYLEQIDPQYVIITGREKYADLICSLHLAKSIKIYHHSHPYPWQNLPKITVPLDAAKFWVNTTYANFCREIDLLDQLRVEKKHYIQEYVQSGGTIELANCKFTVFDSDLDTAFYTVPSEIDYSRFVQNYDQICQILMDQLGRC